MDQTLIINHDGTNDFLLVFMFLSLSGLHTTGFRCNATTIGCFVFEEPSTCEGGGLPMNLLLLLGPTGVAASTFARALSGEFDLIARHTICGSHKDECRPTSPRSFNVRAAVELLTGVPVLTELDSGLSVAIEDRLLG